MTSTMIAALLSVNLMPAGIPQIPAGLTNGSSIYSYAGGGNTFVEISWTFTAGEPITTEYMGYGCINDCQGKVHLLHEQCDTSCDATCRRLHQGVVDSFIETPDDRAIDRLVASFGQFGVPIQPGPGENPREAAISQARGLLFSAMNDSKLESKAHDPALTKTVRSGCWNTTPCSYVLKRPLYRPITMEATVVHFRKTQVEGRTIRTNSNPTKFSRILLVPTGEFGPAEPAVISCRCSVVQQDMRTGMVPGTGTAKEQVAAVTDETTTRPLTGALIKEFGISASISDMNQGLFTVGTTPSHYRGMFYVPAGWEFECEDGSAQDMLLVSDVRAKFMWEPLFADLNPAPYSALTVPIRVLCLDIDKKEPDPSKKYRLVPPRSPELAALARDVNSSSIKGPWDQIRLWIARDYAPLSKIAQRLIPRPGPRMYVRELRKAARLGAFDVRDSRAPTIMELAFLTAEGVDPEDGAWLLRERFRINRDETLAFLKAQGEAFRALYQQGKPEDDTKYLARLAEEIVAYAGEAGLETSLQILTDIVPADQRSVAAKSSTRVGAFLMSTGSEATAQSLLSWLEATRPSWAGFVGINASRGLSEALRARAARLGTKP